MKKIFFCVMILFFCMQTSHAEQAWVWGNDRISVFIEDNELFWDKGGKEFSVTVIDIITGYKNENRNKFNFYERGENWFYSINGKAEVMPVSSLNASGCILDFAKKTLKKSEPKTKSENKTNS